MARSNGKIAGVLLLVASVQFILGLVVAEALYSGYSVADNYISDLGVGPSSIVFNSSASFWGSYQSSEHTFCRVPLTLGG